LYLPSKPPITHSRLLNTSTAWPYRGENPAEPVACVQIAPSFEYQVSFLYEVLFWPPITHNLLLNTVTACNKRGEKPAEPVAWVHAVPSDEY
jgi:hypothetical protein